MGYTYRESPLDGGGYEIGELDTPRTHPTEWCDRRLCEGFWGGEHKAAMVVDVLNQHRDS